MDIKRCLPAIIICLLLPAFPGTLLAQYGYDPEPEIQLFSVKVLNNTSALQANMQASVQTGAQPRNKDSSKPQAYAQGDTIDVEAEIRNTGGAPSGAFSITYYASSDNVINSSDTALGTFPVADLGPTATRTVQHSAQVPGSLAAGQYFIGAIVAYSDGNGGNNTAADPVAVTIAGAFSINSGLNDVWATPGKNGQGILIAVFEEAGVFFSAWFTYDSTRPPDNATAVLGKADQRWVTMQGEFEGDTAELVVYESTGGMFDMASPAPGNPIAIGSAKIVFQDCGSATLSYEIPDLELENTEPLVRIVGDNIPLCQEINNALQR